MITWDVAIRSWVTEVEIKLSRCVEICQRMKKMQMRNKRKRKKEKWTVNTKGWPFTPYKTQCLHLSLLQILICFQWSNGSFQLIPAKTISVFPIFTHEKGRFLFKAMGLLFAHRIPNSHNPRRCLTWQTEKNPSNRDVIVVVYLRVYYLNKSV